MFDYFNVLRNIIENPGADITFLEKKFSVGLLEAITDRGLVLINNEKVTITEKGLLEMEPYKVDNAIIMAAGMGSRFVPYSYYCPKGLIEVNGIPLVERQIKQFLDAGIEDVYIVIGYRGDQYQYLVEKYGVKLIHNLDFANKNNISSIYYCDKAGILGNSYVTPSDIYVEENVYHAYEENSWYATRYFDTQSSEWGIKFDETGLIQEVAKSACGQEALYGAAFFNRDFSNVLATRIREVYDDETYAQWYWEDIYVAYKDELSLYHNPQAGETVYEFECYEELREFDRSYFVEARNPLLDIICRELNCSLQEISGIVPLKVGMTNDSFKFTVKGKDYVFRLAGEGTDVLIDRYAEAKSYEAIAPLKISDEILYFDPKKGIKITKYIENAEPFTEDDTDIMIETIRNLHESGIVVDHHFNINERIEYYFGLCEGHQAQYYSGLREHYDKVRVIRNYVDMNHNELCFCHIDPIVLNFLWSKDKHYLLDWEYSAMSDPYLDLAMIVLFSYLDVEATDELLCKYVQRTPTNKEKSLLYAYCSLVGVLWALWTQYKECLGETYGSYGIDQFKWSELYYDEFLKINSGGQDGK